MLLFLLFIVLVLVSAYFISKLSRINSIQRKQLITLTRQNISLKSLVQKQVRAQETVIIKYRGTPYKSGLIADCCFLYVAPIQNSPVLCELNKNTQIKIIDCAESNNSIWYEVTFYKKNNINNKGWVNAQYMMIYDRHDLIRK